MSITWKEDVDRRDAWGEPAFEFTPADTDRIEHEADGTISELGSGPEFQGASLTAEWIWMGGKSVAGHHNLESADSVYCRRKISCHDPEFSEQVKYTGYRCESAYVNQTAVQEGALGCEHEVEADEGEEEQKCVVGLMVSAENFFKGIGGCMLMIYMFVGFHIVCDDFFVPALNVLCDKLNMPDDIAGATFMAAGASSPELFASLIGVLTHSAVGAGTVVGSELFNMLVIIGGVCLVTPTTLSLDWRPLAREVVFFSLSLVGILLTLNDSVVYFYEALLLIGGYALYVIVCANFNKLITLLCPISTAEDAAIEADGAEELGEFNLDGLTEADLRESVSYSPDQLNGAAFGMDYGQVFMHGFMFKKSEFYTKVRNSKQMWQKRWLVLDEEHGLFYTKKNGKDRVLLSSPASWAATFVEKLSYTEFSLITPGNTLVFKAAKPAFCKAWIRVIEARILHFKTLSPGSMNMAREGEEDLEDFSTIFACAALLLML